MEPFKILGIENDVFTLTYKKSSFLALEAALSSEN